MGDSIFSQPLHKDPIKFGLVKVQSFGFREILKQVIDFFIIDLQKGAEDSELRLGGLMTFDLFEKMEDGSGDETSKILVRA